jgi:membrane-bound lytic murein transglycosylase B
MPCLLCLIIAALLLAACGGGQETRPAQTPAPTAAPAPPAAPALPPPTAGAAATAAAVRDASAAVRAAIEGWRARNGAKGKLPTEVAEPAAVQQQLYLRLAARPRLATRVLERLPGRLRAEVRDVIAARRAISVLNRPRPGQKLPRLKVREPEPAAVLRRHYRAARKRFGVGVPLLAAVHFVETRFGRVRNDSVAGAQGPMQFMPATWRAYGMGGDVHDTRDAIMGAANYLHANGAPGDERTALYHYNPSPLYVSAVSSYARTMRRDPLAFYAFYAWPVRGR